MKLDSYYKYQKYKTKYKQKQTAGVMNPFLEAEIDEFAPDCHPEKLRQYYSEVSKGEFPSRSKITSKGACLYRNRKLENTKKKVNEEGEPYYEYLNIAKNQLKKTWGNQKPECYWNPKEKACHNYIPYLTPIKVSRKNIIREEKNKKKSEEELFRERVKNTEENMLKQLQKDHVEGRDYHRENGDIRIHFKK